MSDRLTSPTGGWTDSTLGRTVLELERELLSTALGDVFGFELLQVGCWGPPRALLGAARTQHARWLAPDADGPGAVRCEFDALPIASASVEAVLLPHTLEYAPRPRELLREVERVLTGEGRVLVCGFSPFGPWGLRHAVSRSRFPEPCVRLFGEHRIRDWLELLGCEVESTQRYLFAPPWRHSIAPQRRRWLEQHAGRLAPPLAGAYLVKARKRVLARTPMRPVWRGAPVVVGGLVEPTSRNAA